MRTVASPMSRPATTSVTVRSPSASSSRRSATGAASATVAIASASAASCSISAWWSAKASSRARKATARCAEAARSASASAASSSMRSVSAYRMSLRVSKCPWAWRSSVSPVTHSSALRGCLAAHASYDRGDARGGLGERVGGLPGQGLDGLELGQHLLGGGPQLRRAACADRRVRASPSQWWESAARTQAAASASYTSLVGVVSATARVMERQSEMPRTRSALPTRASGPVPTGWAAAWVSETYGEFHSCSGWTRCGLVAVRAQHHQRAVVEERPAVAGQRGGDLLADQVVRQQQAAALRARVEGEQHVLAVRGADLALELQVRRVGGAVEGLERAGGQAVAAGEDDALVLGQAAAGPADAVEADDAPGERC